MFNISYAIKFTLEPETHSLYVTTSSHCIYQDLTPKRQGQRQWRSCTSRPGIGQRRNFMFYVPSWRRQRYVKKYVSVFVSVLDLSLGRCSDYKRCLQKWDYYYIVSRKHLGLMVLLFVTIPSSPSSIICKNIVEMFKLEWS